MEAIDWILANGGHPSLRMLGTREDCRVYTPLTLAVWCGFVDIFRRLLQVRSRVKSVCKHRENRY